MMIKQLSIFLNMGIGKVDYKNVSCQVYHLNKSKKKNIGGLTSIKYFEGLYNLV